MFFQIYLKYFFQIYSKDLLNGPRINAVKVTRSTKNLQIRAYQSGLRFANMGQRLTPATDFSTHAGWKSENVNKAIMAGTRNILCLSIGEYLPQACRLIRHLRTTGTAKSCFPSLKSKRRLEGRIFHNRRISCQQRELNSRKELQSLP